MAWRDKEKAKAWRRKNRDRLRESAKSYIKKNWGRIRERMSAERKKRAGILAEIKTTRGCARCGFNSHPVALDFHHINPEEKVDGVPNMSNRHAKWELVLEEVAKCEVLCANCHRIQHWDKQ